MRQRIFQNRNLATCVGRSFVVAALFALPVGADDTLNPQANETSQASPSAILPDAESGRLRQIVADLIRNSFPEEYENEKDWGHQKKIYAGVKIRTDGWKIRTNRRWRNVNHGAWTRYKIELVDPDQFMRIELNNWKWEPDGGASFELTVGGRLHCFARRSRWNLGVQLWSFNVDADADIEITIKGRIGIAMDYAHIPPDLLVKPEVLDATIQVRRFEVHRISDVGGDFAEGVGDLLESLLRDDIVRRQEVKLVEKMNRQIARNEQSLRFSMSNWLDRLLATQPSSPSSASLKRNSSDDKTMSGLQGDR
ncbi:MAG: hypothetical protein R3C05_00150 [Pirellulaceae bacterium]